MMVHLHVDILEWVILKEIDMMGMSFSEMARCCPACTQEECFTAFVSSYLSGGIVFVGVSIESFNTSMLELSLKNKSRSRHERHTFPRNHQPPPQHHDLLPYYPPSTPPYPPDRLLSSIGTIKFSPGDGTGMEVSPR
jgi:hypothetical protein